MWHIKDWLLKVFLEKESEKSSYQSPEVFFILRHKFFSFRFVLVFLCIFIDLHWFWSWFSFYRIFILLEKFLISWRFLNNLLFFYRFFFDNLNNNSILLLLFKFSKFQLAGNPIKEIFLQFFDKTGVSLLLTLASRRLCFILFCGFRVFSIFFLFLLVTFDIFTFKSRY